MNAKPDWERGRYFARLLECSGWYCPRAGTGLNRSLLGAALRLKELGVPVEHAPAVLKEATRTCGREVEWAEVERAAERAHSGKVLRHAAPPAVTPDPAARQKVAPPSRTSPDPARGKSPPAEFSP